MAPVGWWRIGISNWQLGFEKSESLGAQPHVQEHMGVSKNRGTPKSSILIGFSTINHPFWGTPTFGTTHRFVFLVVGG